MQRIVQWVLIAAVAVVGIALLIIYVIPKHGDSSSSDLNPPPIIQPTTQPTPPTGESATISTSSVGYTTPTPTVAGTASGISSVHVTYTAEQGGKSYDEGTFPVTNGTWFSMANQTLPLGDYTVTVSDPQNHPLRIGAFNTDSPLLRQLLATQLPRQNSNYLVGAQMVNNEFPTGICDPAITANCSTRSIQQYPIPTNFTYTTGPAPVKYADWRVLYPGREPVVGWFNNTQQTMDLEIQIAHNMGIDFFSIFWSPPGGDATSRGHHKTGAAAYSNNAPDLFLASQYKNEMRFGLVFDNAQRPLTTAAQWDSYSDEWIQYMKQPEYVHLNGAAVFAMTGASDLHRNLVGQKFPDVSDTGAKGALEELRYKAKQAGISSLLIGAAITANKVDTHATSDYTNDGFNFITTNANGFGGGTAPSVTTVRPYNTFVQQALSYWQNITANVPTNMPVQPIVASNYQHIPNYGNPVVYTNDATPDKFNAFLQDAKSFVDAHQPGLAQKILLIDGWDTYNQSSQMIPNITDQGAFAKEVTQVF